MYTCIYISQTQYSKIPIPSLSTPVCIYELKYPSPPFPFSSSSSPHKLAFPWLSNGKISTNNPDAMNSAPLTYTGALVSRFANMATMGAMMPKTRLADAVMALPVPRSLVGKISGV